MAPRKLAVGTSPGVLSALNKRFKLPNRRYDNGHERFRRRWALCRSFGHSDDSYSVDAESRFGLTATLLVGSNGSSLERGFRNVLALSAPMSTSVNSGFLRPNALLVVILLATRRSSASMNYSAFLDQIRPPAPSARAVGSQFHGVTTTDPNCSTAA